MITAKRRKRAVKQVVSRTSAKLGEPARGSELTLEKSPLAFVICHCCSYTPLRIPDGGACPKCGCHSWESLRHPVRITVREDVE
jgi:Zn finger protein HypA/HybF involved in hydrogenase expression